MYLDQGNELDEELKHLAIKAQQYPPLSPERQLALTKLCQGILQSGRLERPYSGQFEDRIYQDIYQDARQELMLHICKKIDTYDPEKAPVMRWINVLLKQRFFKDSIPKFVDNKVIKKTIKDLDLEKPDQKKPSALELLKECIELDQDNIFKQTHIRNHPEAHFQAIALRYLDLKNWRLVSEELGISIQTLRNFHNKCLKNFKVKMQEYCQEFGTIESNEP